jgi:hypothetical protein
MCLSRRFMSYRFASYSAAFIAIAALLPLALPALALGQPVANPLGYQRAVGGISINSQGLIENAGVDTLGRLRAERAKLMREVPADLHTAAALRKVSLRGLEEAIQESLRTNKPLSDEILLLAGLQDIRYVFVYPEQKDIVLVGYGEGWQLDRNGNFVGVTTGKPVLLLDDLLVALRTAATTAQAGISCSIDPTPEGLARLKAQVAALSTVGNRRSTAASIEKALGRQKVTFSGVPATSHLASVLVAADYRMKRMAMKFEKAPINGLPSFLDMFKSTELGMSNIMQRWWLEPKYESVLRSSDGLAWEFNGGSVKCMTEEDFNAASGQREHSGQANSVAQKWADNMTSHYDELAVAAPVFGELRNCMTLAMVGALVTHERLIDKAGCALPALTDAATFKTLELPAPTQVESKASMVKQGSNWVISASGGVTIRPGDIVGKARESTAPAAARSKALNPGKTGWYWN